MLLLDSQSFVILHCFGNGMEDQRMSLHQLGPALWFLGLIEQIQHFRAARTIHGLVVSTPVHTNLNEIESLPSGRIWGL